MSSGLFRDISDIKTNEKYLFGSKAVHLGILLREGFTVPPGSAISSQLFSATCNSIGADIFESLWLKSDDVVLALKKHEFSDSVLGELEQIFDCLIGFSGEIIVRSSALGEDSETQSFAGVFETVSGVQTFDHLITGIKQVFASIFSDRALEYFLSNDLNPADYPMAVIVQAFMPGDYSGVTFTADPVRHRSDIIVISGAKGRGEQFVSSGHMDFSLTVNKNNLVPDPAEQIQLPPELLQDLCSAARAVEELFGVAQDMEWTWSKNGLSLLQSRNITTLKKPLPESLLNDNLPAGKTWSLARIRVPPLEAQINAFATEAANEGCEISGLEFFYSELRHLGSAEYISPKTLDNWEVTSASYMQSIEEMRKRGENVFTDFALPLILRAQKELDIYREKADSQGLTDTELASFLELGRNFLHLDMTYHWRVVHGCLEQRHMEQFSKTYGLSTNEVIDLVGSPTLFEIMREKLRVLASQLRSHPRWEKGRYAKTPTLFWNRISESTEMAWLKEAVTEFLREYGLLCIGWETSRLYLEAPEFVVQQILAYAEMPGLEHTGDERTAVRQQAERNFFSNLTRAARKQGADKSEVIEKARTELVYYRKAYLVRDNHAFYIDSLHKGYLRLACLLIADRLTKNAYLDSRQEVDFLRYEELHKALENPGDWIRELVRLRRAAWQEDIGFAYPATWGGREDLVPSVENVAFAASDEPEALSVAEDQSRRMLKGFSSSNLKFSCSVVALNDLLHYSGAGIEANSCLVLPDVRAIEASHILLPFRAIICDNGSPFDHIGIWSREHGVAAMFGVAGASTRLKTGDTITFDGENERIILD